MRLKTQFRSAEDSPGFLLWKASNHLQRLHGRCLADLDITPTQFSLMTCLVFLAQDGEVTAARIVAHAGMDKMLVSDLIKALQKKRLLVKTKNAHDARSWLIEPTAKGVQLTNSAVARIEELDEAFFKPVRNLKGLKKDLLTLATLELAAG